MSDIVPKPHEESSSKRGSASQQSQNRPSTVHGVPLHVTQDCIDDSLSLDFHTAFLPRCWTKHLFMSGAVNARTDGIRSIVPYCCPYIIETRSSKEDVQKKNSDFVKMIENYWVMSMHQHALSDDIKDELGLYYYDLTLSDEKKAEFALRENTSKYLYGSLKVDFVSESSEENKSLESPSSSSSSSSYASKGAKKYKNSSCNYVDRALNKPIFTMKEAHNNIDDISNDDDDDAADAFENLQIRTSEDVPSEKETTTSDPDNVGKEINDDVNDQKNVDYIEKIISRVHNFKNVDISIMKRPNLRPEKHIPKYGWFIKGSEETQYLYRNIFFVFSDIKSVNFVTATKILMRLKSPSIFTKISESPNLIDDFLISNEIFWIYVYRKLKTNLPLIEKIYGSEYADTVKKNTKLVMIPIFVSAPAPMTIHKYGELEHCRLKEASLHVVSMFFSSFSGTNNTSEKNASKETENRYYSSFDEEKFIKFIKTFEKTYFQGHIKILDLLDNPETALKVIEKEMKN